MATREKPVAVVTIHNACYMTKREREALTKWLRKQADLVERKGWNFAPQFRARLMKDGNATREGEEVV